MNPQAQAMQTPHRMFAAISKTDDEQRMVYGYASRTSLDSQGETVTKAAMEDALPGYMKFANLREMHGNSAAGVVKSASVDDDGIYIEAHVVDDDAWKKVKAGVYKGFSIGGKAITKTKGVIQKMRLTEISLVDRPANPECVIDLWKGDDMPNPDTAEAQRAAVDELAKMLNSGAVSAEALLALAKGSQAQAPAGEAAPASAPETVAKAEGADASTKATDTAGDGAAADPAVAKADTAAEPATSTPAAAAASAPAASEPVAKAEEGQAASVTTPKMGANESDIKKGMTDVARLALVAQQLAYLASNTVYEAAQEKDGSGVPAMLKEALEKVNGALVTMAGEEGKELADAVDPGRDPQTAPYVGPAPSSVSTFSYSEKPGDIAKRGAKFSADTKTKLGDAHAAMKQACSHLDGLGYADDDTKKGDTTAEGQDAIAKAEGDAIAKVDEAIAKAVAPLLAELEALKKAQAAQPTQPKGRLMVIGKGADLAGGTEADANAAPQPIRKADGSVDGEATALALIQHTHLHGGTPIARR